MDEVDLAVVVVAAHAVVVSTLRASVVSTGSEVFLARLKRRCSHFDAMAMLWRSPAGLSWCSLPSRSSNTMAPIGPGRLASPSSYETEVTYITSSTCLTSTQ